MNHKKLCNNDITVVLQGSCLSEYNGILCVNKSVDSIRKNLPECKIILSTWENERGKLPDNLPVDKIIYNKDPGFQTRNCKPNGKPNNVNRQIVSTINGLKLVQTPYALKMRTDFIMESCKFLKYFNNYNLFDDNYKIFEKRIICCMYGTRKPFAEHYNLPFHISDFSTFGLTKDLIKLYDIPLVTEDEFNWFMIHTDFMPDTQARNRYNAEQSIWINCLKKNGVDVKCQYSTHVNEEIAEQSDKYLVNNFYPISFKKFGIRPLKKNLLAKNNILMYTDYYTTKEWLDLYAKYCDFSKTTLRRDLERGSITRSIQLLNANFLPKFIKNYIRFKFGQQF